MLPKKRSDFLFGKMILRFEAIQHCLVPSSKTFNREEKEHSIELVNSVLKQQSDSAKLKLTLFITIIEITGFVFHGKAFKNLTNDKKTLVLHKFFDSPISLFRKGFWGLNTLARLGVYGQKQRHENIGYQLRGKK